MHDNHEYVKHIDFKKNMNRDLKTTETGSESIQ